MDVIDFVNSIYLGDRAFKRINIDGWSDKVTVQVDSISRIRSPDGNWNFYSEEDIEDGFIAFNQVKRVVWSESGKIPNDRINYLDVVKKDGNSYLFKLSVDSVEEDGSSSEVIIEITAGEICLIDPRDPDIEITS